MSKDADSALKTSVKPQSEKLRNRSFFQTGGGIIAIILGIPAMFVSIIYFLVATMSSIGQLFLHPGEELMAIATFLPILVPVLLAKKNREACILRRSPFWRGTLLLATAPGTFAALVVAAASQVPFIHARPEDSPLDELIYDYIFSLLLLTPAVMTYGLNKFLMSRDEKIWLLPEALVFGKKIDTEKKLKWQDIEQAKMQRLPEINDEVYHEDNPSQHALLLQTKEGAVSTISLKIPNKKQQKQMAKILQKNIPIHCFDQSTCDLLDKWDPDGQEKRKIERKASFTEIWESGLKTNLARTNYVPLDKGATLQQERYEILDYLRSGGFCTTYLARSRSDNNLVVIKESAIPTGLDETAAAKLSELFAREARLIQRCNHEQIVRVLDFFNEAKREYLILQYIDGTPLSLLSNNGSQPSPRQVISWAMEMAELLAYLHSMDPPIIHRDFTPDNLILHRSGRIYLIDFGAANEFIGNATGTLIGKQSYIAPEQFQGKAIPKSDLYSLCASLAFLLTGKEPQPLSESHPKILRPEISDKLDSIISNGTKLNPDVRTESAQLLKAELVNLAD